jgi:outer membrane lipoprotein-sorting protein
MKVATRSAVLLLVLVSISHSVNAQTPNVAQLLRDVQAKYGSLQSYSAAGEVTGGIKMEGGAAILPGGQSQEIRTAFTIKLARPQMYRIVWEQQMGQKDGLLAMASKGAVWSDGQSRFINTAGQTMQPLDTETALAMATGVSNGAANTIPSIFFDLSANGVTSILRSAVLAGNETIDGEDCYVVKAHSDTMDRTIWISKASKLIRQVMTAMSGNPPVPLELTDSDASKVLESMGQKPTEDAIRALRAQMTAAAELMKSVKTNYYSLEKHRDIKTDDPMSPSDFR